MALVETSRPAEDVLLVELNDPERYNALSSRMITELKDVFLGLRDDRQARVVILAARGRGFCAGANMGGDDDTPDRARGRGPVGFIHEYQEHIAELMLAVHEARPPVIAAVHGGAVGGGIALSLACDMRIASPDAYFASHFIRVGLSSCDVGTSYWLPRIVGPTMAAELMLTGRRVPAEEALRIGLINKVVEREALLDAALELAAGITANSEFGVIMTKLGMWANFDAPSLRAAMELENRTQVLGTFTGNMSEAGRAFREKRDPDWAPM